MKFVTSMFVAINVRSRCSKSMMMDTNTWRRKVKYTVPRGCMDWDGELLTLLRGSENRKKGGCYCDTELHLCEYGLNKQKTLAR